MTDVALLVLEVPDPHDEEVSLPDPHPLLQLPRDSAQAGLAVRTHHANAGCSKELVRDPVYLLLAVRGEPDADDLFLGHDGTILKTAIRILNHRGGHCLDDGPGLECRHPTRPCESLSIE